MRECEVSAVRSSGMHMSGKPGRSGGARPGSGPIQVRLRIGKVAGQELRILTFARRGVTGNQAITPDDVAAQIIHEAWLEYDAGVEEAGEDAS